MCRRTSDRGKRGVKIPVNCDIRLRASDALLPGRRTYLTTLDLVSGRKSHGYRTVTSNRPRDSVFSCYRSSEGSASREDPPRRQILRASADSQQSPERSSIIEIENRIYEGIESAIDITEPRDEVYHPVRWAASRTEWHDDVHKEEWQPADNEDAHDDAQGPRRPPLLGQRDPLSFLDELIDGRGGDGAACTSPASRRRGPAASYRYFGRLVVDQRRLRLQAGRRALVVIRLRADRFLGVVGLAVSGGLHRTQPALPSPFPQSPTRRQEDL